MTLVRKKYMAFNPNYVCSALKLNLFKFVLKQLMFAKSKGISSKSSPLLHPFYLISSSSSSPQK